MKKVLLFVSILTGLLISKPIKAQYCGSSGTTVCTANTSFTTEGFDPPEDSLPCIVDGVLYSQVIQVHTPSTATAGGTTYPLESVKIDTISNLPCGMCWAMGNSAFTIAGNATGCLKMTGTTHDAPGQYLLHIIVDATVSFGGIPVTDKGQNLSTQGLKYFVRVQLPGGPCVPVDTLGASNTPSASGTLNAPTIAGNLTFCNGSSTTLTASGTNIYAYGWSNGTIGASTIITTPGTYTVTAYGECTSVTASKTVTLLPLVRDTITAGGPVSFCPGGNVGLSVPAGSTSYLWSTGATTNAITASTGATYKVTVTNSSGCSAASAGTVVTINALPSNTVTVSGSLAICQGNSVTLSGATGLTYNWSTGATTQSITVTQVGAYTLSVTNANNCSAVSSVNNVTVNALPNDTVTAGGPLTFCSGGQVTLTGVAGLTYHWSNGNTTQSVTATTSGSYTLTVTNTNSCSAASAAATVTVNALPDDTITAGGPTTFCAGGNVILNSATGLTYHWSTSATTQSITASVAGPYTVTVTNANNCSAVSAATNVIINALPNNTITAGGPLTFCSGGNVTLSGAAGLTYHWGNGSTLQSISVTQSNSYTLTVTNSNTCSAVSAPSVVTVNALPDDTITAGGPTAFCTGGNVILNAATGLTYQWGTGATTQSITVSLAGPYTLTVTNTNNCSAVSAAASITVYALPNDTITAGGPLSFCPGGSVSLSAATGLTYHWSNGSTLQAISAISAGSYNLTVTNSNNCSAVSTPVTVAIYTLPNDTVTAGGPTTFCSGGGVTLTAAAGLNYNWSTGATTQSINATQAISYVVTVTGSNQCSAVSAPTVISFTAPTVIGTQPLSQVTCINGAIAFGVIATGDNITYQWLKNGVNISGQQSPGYNIAQAALADTGNYRVIVSGTCGTDTSNIATLAVTSALTFSQQPLSQSACIGSSVGFTVVANGANTAFQWQKSGVAITNATAATYTISQVNATDTGSYSCYVTSNCGNATSGAGTLTVNQPSASSFSMAICSGSSYNFNGQIITTAGTYYDTLANVNSCDSIVTLQLTLKQPTGSTTNASICQGGAYNFNGLQLNAAGTYYDTLSGSNSCDSIVTLVLTVNQPTFSQVSAAICSNGSYNFNGRTVTAAGNYTDTLTNSLACDSFVTLTLTVNPVLTSSYSASICAGSSYNFNGQILTLPGNYNNTLQTVAACDSVVTLTLIVNPALSSSYNASVCAGSSYSFNGHTLTLAGNYTDTLQTHAGCDSIVTLNLTINQPTGSSVSVAICPGATYSFGSNLLSAAGTYYDTLSNSNSCDSIITLHLTVNQPISTNLNVGICSGSTYPFNGQQLTVAGTYTAHFTAQNGCDSLVTLVLQVNSFVNSSSNGSVCAGSTYNFNGHNLTAAGTYTDTLPSSAGCDSIVTLHLVVNQATTGSIHASICSGAGYSFNGRQLTTAGNYTETLTNSNGCDSTLTLTLQVNSFVTTNLAGSICPGGSYIFNGRSLSVGGVYTDTLTAQAGCDSIVILTLTIYQTNATTIHATICSGSSYSFNGQQLTVAGTYTETITSSHGCDSVVTLNLQLNSFVTGSATVNICSGDNYNFNGQILNATGTYTDTLTANGGCDSIVTLTLTVRPVTTQNIQAVTCAGSSYNFNGQQLNSPGIYTDTLTSVYGCDSIVILQLSITPAAGITISAVVCNGGTYNFYGQQLTTPGIYKDTLTTTGGCDSVITLKLNVGNGYNIQLHQSVCEGSSYSFNNQYLAISGTYSDTLTTSGGCDSITTLFLTVMPSPVITWAQADTICDNNNATQFILAAPSPAGGILSGTGLNSLVLTVNGSGTYPVTYTYVAGDGCSNTETKNLVVESCLGIETVNAETDISIYPNPANDVVTAQSNGLANMHNAPLVYDITGKLIEVTFTQQADKITFNTGGLSAGVYLIKFNISNTIITKHFVKAE